MKMEGDKEMTEGKLEAYARMELDKVGAFSEDGDFYGGMTGNAVMELVKVFSSQGHSGMSAPLVLKLFSTVASWKPLSALQGTDDEWTEISDGLYQNKRCSRVFKGPEGAYDMGGKVFRDPDGCCYTNRDSRVAVTFPYTPKTEYVDR